MPLVVPDSSERYHLDYLMDKEDRVYHLYQNDYTPTETSALADFTEANFTGYSAQTVAATAWNNSVTDGSGTTCADAPDISWTNTGTTSQNIYGYYVTDTANTTLLWAERFSNAPRTLNPNDTFTLTPKMCLD